MSEEDDPVMREIPVYLSKTLAEKLFLFQYPIRPTTLSYENVNVLESRIKPVQQHVELELELNTRNPNYDQSKGEQIALNVDGKDYNSGEKYFKSMLMDKQVLSSTRAVIDTSRYAVGVFQDNELHLNPLQGILHLRPNFSYADKSDKKAREDAKEMGEGDQSGEEDEEAKPVTVKFARQESERIKRAREKSFGYLRKKSEEEPWYKTSYYNSKSEASELERSKLFCMKPEDEINELSIPHKQYMDYLVPPEVESDNSKPSLPTNVISLNSLKTLSLAEQVKMLLKNAKLIQFKQLLSLLAQDLDPKNVLKTLQQVAVLVQGNWVVRSEILYPKDTSSGSSGVPADLMCRGRDYVLYLFTQNRFVDRKNVSTTTKLPPEEVKEILMHVCRLRINRGWELMLPFDQDFVNRYPEIVERQQMLWDSKQKQLNQSFKETQSDNSLGSQSPSKTRRRRTKSQRESFSSDNESGTECVATELHKGARRKSFSSPKVVRTDSIKSEPKVDS